MVERVYASVGFRDRTTNRGVEREEEGECEGQTGEEK
jgi:hypothetical protein